MQDSRDFPVALTYDDVLLVPQRSGVTSRSDVDTRARLTPTISLSVPIVSANMDTVTEWRLAIAMARAGGVGIIHRFLTVEEQADQVRRVKRSESFIIDQPLTTAPGANLEDVLREFIGRGINGMPIVSPDGKLLGLVTRRDLAAAGNAELSTLKVSDVMTPIDRLVLGEPSDTLATARKKMAEARVEKLPLVDEDGCLAGLVTMKDINHIELFPGATKDSRGRLRVGAAVGVRGDFIERAQACAEAGADLLCLDIAHGHSEGAISAVQELRRSVDIEVIAGNVATAEGARDLIRAGAHSIKVGVGPGSVCTTRIVAGVGVPQLSAVLECAEACADADVPLCADGGIRTPGDFTKAIAAGADTAMVGNLLAGTTESPGRLIERGGRTLKVHRGMASGGAMTKRRQMEASVQLRPQVSHLIRVETSTSDKDFGNVVPEGVEAVVPYRGDVVGVLGDLVGGLRSGMSYSNAHNITEFHEKAKFVRITTAGQIESRPHDVEI